MSFDDSFTFIREGLNRLDNTRTDSVQDAEDTVLVAYNAADVGFARVGDDLRIVSQADAADNQLSSAAIVEDFYLGGHHVVERLQTADSGNYYFDLVDTLLS